jgi:hypothetical protein
MIHMYTYADCCQTGGFYGIPYEFEASITPRSAERAAIIQESFANTEMEVKSLADEANNGRWMK